jgi:putative addiction module component (TIGR02574 family)
MTRAKLPIEFKDMSPSERILYVQDLWDEIASSDAGEKMGLTDAQRETLDERLAAHRAAPGTAATWQEVQDRIRSGE